MRTCSLEMCSDAAQQRAAQHSIVHLHVACDTIVAAKDTLPPAASQPKIRNAAEKAVDYQEVLVAELQQQWLPIFSGKSTWICEPKALRLCIRVAVYKTMPLASMRHCAPAWCQSLSMTKLVDMQDWPDRLCLTAHRPVSRKNLLQRSNMTL